MNKSERELIAKYFYFVEERFIQAVKDCEYRYTRRNLDSIDLLEEILARNSLDTFKQIEFDITRLLKLNESIDERSQRFKLVPEDIRGKDFKSKIG